MRFALSPEHADFAASIRKLLDATRTPAAVRAWAAGEHDTGRTLLGQLAETGALGLAIDEQYDGLGAEPLDLVVAFVEIGRGAAPGPLVESAAAIPALLQALTDDAPARRLLPGIAEGALGTIAFTEPGRNAVALDADIAETVLVTDGTRLSTGTPGEPVRSVDPSRRLYRVEAGETLAEGPEVADAVAVGFDCAALANAAQLLGAGRALLEASTEYVKQRRQFGRVIGEFQAIKQKLADVSIAVDLAEPLLHRAALTMDSPARARDVSAAAVAAIDAAHLAARTALQVHGAIGYTAEYDLSLWLTRVTALRSAWGTTSLHRGRVADALSANAGQEQPIGALQ